MKNTYLILFCLTFIMNFGCSSQILPEGMPKPYPVKLTIMMNGEPLSGATVSAYPVDKSLSKWGGRGSAKTDYSGIVQMYTHGVKGLVEGEFVVTVEKQEMEYNPNDQTGLSNLYEFFVDTSYWDKTTSPLRINVGSANRSFTLEVEEFNEKNYDFKKFQKKLKK